MPVETDYKEGVLKVVRKGVIFKEWKFKEFVAAKQFKPIVDLQIELQKIEQQKKTVSDEEERQLDTKWYELVTTTGLVNPLSYAEAEEVLTNSEMRFVASEVFVFLQNWSSIEEARLFSKRLQEAQSKGETPSKDSQT